MAQRRRNRRGHTTIELLVAAGIMGMISASCMTMMIASMKSFEGTTVQTYSDSDAVLGMQHIVSDIREAKSYSVLDSGSRLHLVFPKVMPAGNYNNKEADPGNTVDYYLSDRTGTPGQSGTYLWRVKSGTVYVKAGKNVSRLAFDVDTVRSLKITMVTSNRTVRGAKTTGLTERVVYLRNY